MEISTERAYLNKYVDRNAAGCAKLFHGDMKKPVVYINDVIGRRDGLLTVTVRRAGKGCRIVTITNYSKFFNFHPSPTRKRSCLSEIIIVSDVSIGICLMSSYWKKKIGRSQSVFNYFLSSRPVYSPVVFYWDLVVSELLPRGSYSKKKKKMSQYKIPEGKIRHIKLRTSYDK